MSFKHALWALLLFTPTLLIAQDNPDIAYANLKQTLASMRADFHEKKISLEQLTTETDSLYLAFVRRQPNAQANLEILKHYRVPIAGDLQVIEPFFNSMSPQLRATPEGKDFATVIDHVKKTAVGCMAPDFVQPDMENKQVRLSDFRGQYVLVDFWASWCHPCRGESPYLVAAYNQFKDRKFTLLSISLDDDRDKWTTAIKEDHFTWTQLCDFNVTRGAAADLYAINAVPRNFLVDPTGKIIAKDLRGGELAGVLEKLLK